MWRGSGNGASSGGSCSSSDSKRAGNAYSRELLAPVSRKAMNAIYLPLIRSTHNELSTGFVVLLWFVADAMGLPYSIWDGLVWRTSSCLSLLLAIETSKVRRDAND